MNLSTYIKLQKILLTAFFVSLGVMFFSYFLSSDAGTNVSANVSANTMPANVNNATANVNNNANVVSGSNSTVNPPPKSEETGYGWLIVGAVSVVSSITTLFGFISTTVLAWRKEKRDVEIIRYDNEKKELELEKLKWELEKMKQAEEESKPNRRKTKKPE